MTTLETQGPAKGGKLLDFEQYIDYQLERTRSKIRATDVVTAVVFLTAVALGVLFVEVVLDHIIGLPTWFRATVLALGAASALTYGYFSILRPILRRVNHYYAARTIEVTDPKFKNSLITYLDLRRRKQEVPKSILAALETKAVHDLSVVEPDHVVDQSMLTRAVYALAGVIVAICIYSLLTPKSIVDSTGRAFLVDLARPTDTRLVNIKPGDDPERSTIIAGENVAFTVEVQGKRPESVTLHYSLDDGRNYQTAELARGKSDFEPWQTTLRDVQTRAGADAVLYRFTGGDAESRTYRLNVRAMPMVSTIRHDLTFPGYIQRERRAAGLPENLAAIEGGDVEAIEGTLVTVRAETNIEARAARLEFDGEAEGGAGAKRSIAMNVDPDNAYMLTGEFPVEADGTYVIKFETKEGKRNPRPVVHQIKALPDRSPTVQFLRPEPVVQVPSNGTLALRLKAEDDHGLKEATLHVQQDREILQPARNYLDGREPTPSLIEDDIIDLEKLRVRPGTKVEYWLSVRDTKEPQANRVETARQVIEVVDPLPPEQAERQRQEQAESRQEPNPPDAEQPRDGEALDQPREGEPQPETDTARQPGQGQQPEGADAAQGAEGQGEPRDGQPNGDQPHDGGAQRQQTPEAASGGQPGQTGSDAALNDRDRETLRRLEEALRKANGSPPPNPQDPSRQGEQRQGGGQQARQGQTATPEANAPRPGDAQDQGRQQGQASPRDGVKPQPPDSRREGGGQPQGDQGVERAEPGKPNETPRSQPNRPESGGQAGGAEGVRDGQERARPGDHQGNGAEGDQAAGDDSARGQAGHPRNPQGEPVDREPSKPRDNVAQRQASGEQSRNAGEGADRSRDDPTGRKPEPRPEGEEADRDGGANQPLGGQPQNRLDGKRPDQTSGKPQDAPRANQSGPTGEGPSSDSQGANDPAGRNGPKDKPEDRKPSTVGESNQQAGAMGDGPRSGQPQAAQGGDPKPEDSTPRQGEERSGQAGQNTRPDGETRPRAGDEKREPGRQVQSNAGQSGEREGLNQGEAGQGDRRPETMERGKPAGEPNQREGGASSNAPGEKGDGQNQPQGPGERDATKASAAEERSRPDAEADGQRMGGQNARQADQPDGQPNGAPDAKRGGEAGRPEGQDDAQAGRPGKEQARPEGGRVGEAGGQDQSQRARPGAQRPEERRDGQSGDRGRDAGEPSRPEAGSDAPNREQSQDARPDAGNPKQGQGEAGTTDQESGRQGQDGAMADQDERQGNAREVERRPGQSDQDANGQPRRDETRRDENGRPRDGAEARRGENGQQGGQQRAQSGQRSDAGEQANARDEQGRSTQQGQRDQSGQQGQGEQQGRAGRQGERGQEGQGRSGQQSEQGQQGGQQGQGRSGQDRQGQEPGQGENGESEQKGQANSAQQSGQGQQSQAGEQGGQRSGQQGGEQGQQGGQQSAQQGDEQGQQGGQQAAQQGGEQGQQGGQQSGQQGQMSGQQGQSGQQGESGQQGQGGKQGQSGQQGQQGGQGGQADGNHSDAAGAASDGMPTGGGDRVGGSAAPLGERQDKDPAPERAQPPADAGAPLVPEGGASQSDLVLRQIKDLIAEGRDTSRLEEATGMSREELEQFVRKFEKPEREAPGEGRELKGDVREDKVMEPLRGVGERNRSPLVSGSNQRGPSSATRDTFSDQTQGLRSQAPPEIRSRFEAYQSSISRSRGNAPARPAAPPAGRPGP
jgi:hypothetical protein